MFFPPNYIVGEQITQAIRNININKNEYNTSSNNSKHIKLLYHNQMHSNYKKEEKILKNLINTNISPTDPSKKIN